MPLKHAHKGASKREKARVRSENIEELVESGRPVKQAAAIAYSEERHGKKRRKK